jgi:hypothetical protein
MHPPSVDLWRHYVTSLLTTPTLVALSPLALAPVRSTTEVRAGATEVRARAAKSSSTLPVHNRTASLALLRHGRLSRGLSRRLLVVALSEASLASVTAVEVLILDIVLRAAVTGRRAAAVEEAVGTGTGASDTTLGVAADIDFRDGGREAGSGGGSLSGCGLHSGDRSGLAG